MEKFSTTILLDAILNEECTTKEAVDIISEGLLGDVGRFALGAAKMHAQDVWSRAKLGISKQLGRAGQYMLGKSSTYGPSAVKLGQTLHKTSKELQTSTTAADTARGRTYVSGVGHKPTEYVAKMGGYRKGRGAGGPTKAHMTAGVKKIQATAKAARQQRMQKIGSAVSSAKAKLGMTTEEIQDLSHITTIGNKELNVFHQGSTHATPTVAGCKVVCGCTKFGEATAHTSTGVCANCGELIEFIPETPRHNLGPSAR